MSAHDGEKGMKPEGEWSGGAVRRGERKKKGGGRKFRNKHFMDVALDAYIRHVTLNKMLEVEGLAQGQGMAEAEALAAVGAFPERGAYQELWERAWGHMTAQRHGGEEQPIVGAIEAAVREAMLEEQARRADTGDETIEDTRPYTTFIATAMGRLLEEADGEIEEMDEEEVP